MNRILRFIICGLCLAVALGASVFFVLQGFRLPELPKKEEVLYCEIFDGSYHVSAWSSNEIEKLLEITGDCHYQLGTHAEGVPKITIVYHLKDTTVQELKVNRTSVWWKGKDYLRKDTINIIDTVENLYFSNISG